MPDLRRLFTRSRAQSSNTAGTRRSLRPKQELPPPLTDEEHAHLLHMAKIEEGTRYLTENVLGNTEQTFGIEIEYEGGDGDEIARSLYDAGICSSPRQHGYHAGPRQEGKWTVERDGSVTGGELVSPVMRDTPDSWRQLKLVCDTIRASGGHVSRWTGGHVNIGTASSDVTNVATLKRLVQLFAWSEDLLYRTGAAAGSFGVHRGADGDFRYCSPPSISKAGIERVRAARSVGAVCGEVSGSGIQLSRFGTGGQSRIEFRYNDSSLDPERLQANIMIDCALMRCAATMSPDLLPTAPHPLGTHEASGGAGDNLLREFARIVMRRPEEKLKLYSIFERTDWQPRADRSHEFMKQCRRQSQPLPLRYLPEAPLRGFRHDVQVGFREIRHEARAGLRELRNEARAGIRQRSHEAQADFRELRQAASADFRELRREAQARVRNVIG